MSRLALLLAALCLAGCMGGGGGGGGSSASQAAYPHVNYSAIIGAWSARCTSSWGSQAYIPVGTVASFEVDSLGRLTGWDDAGHQVSVVLNSGDSVDFSGFFISSRTGVRTRVFVSTGRLVASIGDDAGVAAWTIARVAGGG